MPLIMVALLLFAIFQPPFIFNSEKGPGSMHAPFLIALIVGLVIGVLAQKTRMCFVGGWRDLSLVKDIYLFSGIAAFFVGALVVNLLTGAVNIGFEGQSGSHTNQLWNFMGMVSVSADLVVPFWEVCPLSADHSSCRRGHLTPV
jgi:YedE family putative selenium metabolism protein